MWRKIQVKCKDCNGTGVRLFPDNPDEVCADCQGSGYIEWGRVSIPNPNDKEKDEEE